jgi:hypothetical protein
MAAGRDPRVRIIEPMAVYGDSDAYLDELIEMTKAKANWAAIEANQFCSHLEMLSYHPRWKERIEGEPKTWDRFYDEVLGWPAGFVAHVREGLRILAIDDDVNPTLGKAAEAALAPHPGPVPGTMTTAVREVRAQAVGEDAPKSSREETSAGYRAGTNTTYWRARLERDRPDVLAQVDAGEFGGSVVKAARKIGLLKRTVIVYPDDLAATAKVLRKHFKGDRRKELRSLLREVDDD